jgi:FixJ family two-component response regulator
MRGILRVILARVRALQGSFVAQEQPLISIVDDDDGLRAALTGLVRSLGYRASAYASAEDFLAAGVAGESACIVSDIHMPEISGIELKQRLAQDGCAAPMIMITARTEAGLRERAFASGAFCVLQKPFAAEALIDCLDKALAG